jgi:hypothetical protein
MYRINCGGLDYTDSAGNLWAADFLFQGGDAFNTVDPIAETNEQMLYQSERYDTGTPGPLYSLPLSRPGVYLVNLKFADIFYGTSLPGDRIFDVIIENTVVVSNFDITAIAGWATAIDLSFFVEVTDGSLDISIRNVVQSGKINAIEVLARPEVSPSAAMNAASPSGSSFAGALPWAVPVIVVCALAAIFLVMAAMRAHKSRQAGAEPQYPRCVCPSFFLCDPLSLFLLFQCSPLLLSRTFLLAHSYSLPETRCPSWSRTSRTRPSLRARAATMASPGTRPATWVRPVPSTRSSLRMPTRLSEPPSFIISLSLSLSPSLSLSLSLSLSSV